MSNWPDKCPKCKKPMTATGFADKEGFICTHCEGKRRKQKKKKKKPSSR